MLFVLLLFCNNCNFSNVYLDSSVKQSILRKIKSENCRSHEIVIKFLTVFFIDSFKTE